MSYDIAIVRSDIPDDIAFMVACDWQDRGLEYLDMVGTSCNPTYNYARFFHAFHVRPTTDLHGRSAIVVKDMLDDALKEIGKHSIDELERKYFLDNNGKVIRWGSIPNAIQWLRDVRDYCERNPGYKFIGRDAEIPGHGSASLGTVRTFSPEYAQPSDRQWRKLLEETAELAAVGMDWVADGTSDSRIYDRLVEEYCDVVEALGTFAIAYGITDEDIRKGMGECEKRFRDGDAGGRKTVEENTIIDGLAELSTRLKEAQSRKHKKAPTKLSELEK